MNNDALLNNTPYKLGHYLDNMKIDVLLEWKDLLQNVFDKKYLKDNWEVYKTDIGDGRTDCLIRKQRPEIRKQ